MNTSEEIKIIKKHIRRAKFEDALDKLDTLIDSISDFELERRFTLLSARFNTDYRAYLHGTKNNDEITNRIIHSMTYLLYEVEKSIKENTKELHALDELNFSDKLGSVLEFQHDIEKTYSSMWERILSVKPKPKRIWATYLNPDAFSTGDLPKDLKIYYKKAEQIDVADYRRIFAIYPKKKRYNLKRESSIFWLKNHIKRTSHLEGYQVRFVELEFQAAEVLIDDIGVNFSFPISRASEGGWTSSKKEVVDLMKDYFQQVWDKGVDINEIIV